LPSVYSFRLFRGFADKLLIFFCKIYYWLSFIDIVRRSSSSWGSCSKQCGGGIQSRRYTTCRPRCVYPHRLTKGEPVRPVQTEHLQRRSLALCRYGFGYSYNSCSTHYQSRTCNTHACHTGKYCDYFIIGSFVCDCQCLSHCTEATN
jgi:hypothetical protein